MTGQSNVVDSIVVDPNNTPTVGITDQGVRARVDNSSFTRSTGPGIVIGTLEEGLNSAAASKFDHDMSIGNYTGIFCQNTSDVMITRTELENSCGHALWLHTCGGFRLENDNFGSAGTSSTGQPGNQAHLSALLADGTHTSLIRSQNGMVVGCQFGSNYGADMKSWATTEPTTQPSTRLLLATSWRVRRTAIPTSTMASTSLVAAPTSTAAT